METFYDKYQSQRRTFGENEQRKMRYVIETSSPKILEKEQRWKDIKMQLDKQAK